MPGIRRSISSGKTAKALLLGGVLGCWLSAPTRLVRGDEFGRIIGAPLFEVTTRSNAKGTARISLRTIESLPEVVRGERSALIVATTDQGNVAKLLVSAGLRRQASTGDPPRLVPVLSLDRFETIDRGDRVARRARGRDVVLFEGFEFDLDSGQVVPAGFGGDVRYSSRGAAGPELVALGTNQLYAIDRPLSVPGVEPGRPSAGPAVVATDFGGRFSLIANGQTSGALELNVGADGAVAGRFRSDRNGSMYAVTGKVAADLPRRIDFEIQFPRSRQVFEGLLWTDEKNVFAGTVRIADHPFSFLAVREGTALAPEPIDATSPPRAPTPLKDSTRVITMEEPDRYGFDGVPMSAEGLAAALAAAGKAQTPIEVLLRVPPATPFERFERAVRLVRGAGISTIRLTGADPH